MTVAQRFNSFLSNIQLTEAQVDDGTTKHTGVRTCLNNHYWNSASGTANSSLVGSWGKKTRVRPTRDIDVLFELPASVYERFNNKSGNKQSQLLQEVKGVLDGCYTATTMRGDGQVVIIPFATQAVEVAPAFSLTNGQYYICDTNNGGSWKTIDPVAELNSLSDSDKLCNSNTRALIRMMKKWQENCSVEMKSFWFERLAVEFLQNWEFRDKSATYYDWMTREFLKHLVGKANGYLFLPNTYECISLGDKWKSKAETARDRAIKACDYESQNKDVDAGTEWRKIFGVDMPWS